MEKVDAIIFDNVTKYYRDPSFKYVFKPRVSVGVEKISFSVRRGETFGLLGLNGAGKTTTFKLMLGLLKPDIGNVTVGGFSPSFQREKALSLVGYLPEISYFHKNLTVFETMKFLLTLSGPEANKTKSERIKSIDETLSIVGLSSVKSRKVGKLSKGMMQRLGIAQSLIHNPEILIYDEPTSGLDPLGIKEMRSLLENLKKDGRTIIFSSHITSEVEKICDRVGILHKGRLLKILSDKDFTTENSGKSLEEIFVETVSSAGA